MAFFGKDLRLGEHVIRLSGGTCLMGILNVTPDSFSDGERYMAPEKALDRALEMVSAGAGIIDVGGESSRPGASPVDEKEEIRRVIPVVRLLRKKCGAVISVDTAKSEVARLALDEGAGIINDITALHGDSRMAEVVASRGAAVCLMHMKGTPRDMQRSPSYVDLIGEITEYLSLSVEAALEAGIDRERIIIDPGIGFGKTKEHNLEILKKLSCFKVLSRPIMVGVSRKSFLGEITGKTSGERIFGTAAAVTAAILNGADIVRVHDVAEIRDAALVADAIKGAG